MAVRSYLHRYGPHPEQVADLIPGEPMVVLVHGGFWRERYRRDLMAPLALDLAARGIGSYNVEYRRLDCDGGWPETVEDVRSAVDELDEPPFAAIGHSAGGYLALMLADRVERVVGQAAVTDLREGVRLNLGDGVVKRFAGEEPPAEADPIRLAPLPAEVLLIHGTADDTVPAAMSEGFPGAAVSLRHGEGHFEHIDPASGAWKEAVAWIER
jgi:acetyl esterase/lipase